MAAFGTSATVHGPSGEIIGYTRKVHIPQGDGYHEDHYLAARIAFRSTRWPG